MLRPSKGKSTGHHFALSDGPPTAAEKMGVELKTIPSDPDEVDGENFKMVYEFAVGFPGSGLRDLSEREEFKEMSQVLMRAHRRFAITAGFSGIQFTTEKRIKELYDDIKDKEELYMILLEPVENSAWTEKISGMLGTLCTIWRQRGSYHPCRELLEGWYTRMLELNGKQVQTRIAEGWGSPEDRLLEQQCLKVLWYKYHLIRLNLSMGIVQTVKNTALHLCSGASVRVLIQDEMDRSLPDKDDQYRW